MKIRGQNGKQLPESALVGCLVGQALSRRPGAPEAMNREALKGAKTA